MKLKEVWLQKLAQYRNEAQMYFLGEITYSELRQRRKRTEKEEMNARHNYLDECKKQGVF